LFAVPRIAAVEAKILADVAAFWDAVERGEPPKQVLPRDYETLARLFPTDNGETIDLSADNELPGLLAERVTLKASMKRLAEIDTAIKAKVGEAKTALASGWRISYATHERKEYTVPAQTVRTLRITAMNGETNGK